MDQSVEQMGKPVPERRKVWQSQTSSPEPADSQAPALSSVNPTSPPRQGHLVTTLPHESPLIPNPGPCVLLSPGQPGLQSPNPFPAPTDSRTRC